MSRILVEIKEMPPVIRDSARITFAAHGYLICDHNGLPLRDEALTAIYSELGRNLAQAIVSLDTAAAQVLADLGRDETAEGA